MYEPQPKLGRHYAPDLNDRRFLLSPPRQEAAQIESRYWFHQGVLDQGDSSACVGFSTRQWLNMGPVRNLNGPSAMDIYRTAQTLDEWPGTEPAYYGTSVRASFKHMKAIGLVERYNWAFDLDTVVDHVLTVGPMVLGTSYFKDMMATDKQGFIHAGGRMVGGHAYVLKGVSRTRKCPDGSVGCGRIINSWSDQWGQKGLAWISFKDLDALIKDYGEACAAVEAKSP